MGSDKVPVLDEKSNYSDWKRRVQWWKKVTTVKPEAGAAALIMHMSGKPEAVAIQLDVDELSKAGGIDVLIAELDKLYEKDQTQSVFTSIDSFMNYRRSSEVPMEEYVREFNHRYKNLVQKRSAGAGGTKEVFEDGVLAYFLLHHANLSDHQKTLIRATVSKLSYENMESQLKRAYGADYTNVSSSSSSASSETYSIGKTKVKEEPVNTYFQQSDQSCQEEDPQEVFYQQRYPQSRDFSHLRDLLNKDPSDKDPSDKEPSMDKDLRFKDRAQGTCMQKTTVNNINLDPDKEHNMNDQHPYVVIFVRKQTIS